MAFFKLLWSFVRHSQEWLDSLDDFRKYCHEAEVEQKIQETINCRRTMWGD